MIKNIVVIILLLGFIAVVIFLDVPKVQEILDLRRKVETQEEALFQKEELMARVEKLKNKYEDNEESLTKVNYILPSEEEIPNLIVQLEAMALEAGLILERIEFHLSQETGQSRAAVRDSTQEVVEDYKTLSINLDLVGGYFAFKNFLELIEENIRLMNIDSISFSPQYSEETELLLFNFNTILTTYYQ